MPSTTKPSPIVPFDPGFLGDGVVIPLPSLRGPALANALRDGEVYDFTYYSAVMNEKRKLATYTAANVDGARWVSLKRPGGWSYDERIGPENQLDDTFYNAQWTRGHLTRRNDVCWGPRDLASKANHNSFFLANAAPQHANFNGDEWGELEDWFLTNAKSDRARAVVFTGPVFRTNDPVVTSDGVKAQVPAGFWKIIAIQDPLAVGVDVTASAFILRQDELWQDAVGARLAMLKNFQVPISLVERLTCLDFGDLRRADPLGWALNRSAALGFAPRQIYNVEDIVISTADRRRNSRYPRIVGEGGAGCGCHQADEAAVRDPAASARIERLERSVAMLQAAAHERTEQAAAALAAGPASAEHRNAARRLRELAERSERILGGTPIVDGAFRDCVYIDVGGFICTGVLVGERVVATAAHCLFDDRGRRISPQRVFIGNNVQDADSNTEWIRVVDHTPHPDYAPGGDERTPSCDIAVLVLERAARKAQPVPMIPAKEVQLISTSVLFVGFGTSDRNASGGSGIKRRVSFPLAHLWVDASDDGLKFEAEKYHFDLKSEFTAIDPDFKKDTCPGDSGGPAYIVEPDGSYRVLGLTSRGFLGSRFYCSEGGIYTQIAPYLDWLRATVAPHGVTVLGLRGVAPVPVPIAVPVPNPGEDFEPGCC